MKLVTPDIGLLFWMCLSFGIVVLLLAKYAWKPILAAVKERETSIDNALNEAKQARTEIAHGERAPLRGSAYCYTQRTPSGLSLFSLPSKDVAAFRSWCDQVVTDSGTIHQVNFHQRGTTNVEHNREAHLHRFTIQFS